MESSSCEFPKFNASRGDIDEALRSARTIAVVGISNKPDRPSNWISRFLIERGFHVIGVNPKLADFEGHKVYPTLAEVPGPVDIVDFFVRGERVLPMIEDAIKTGARTIWMQEGVVNNEAAEKARAAGLGVIMNRCIYKELRAR